jgi:hypothetical protein
VDDELDKKMAEQQYFVSITATKKYYMLRSAYSDEIGTDSEANRHAVRANRQSEESERSDAGILFIT